MPQYQIQLHPTAERELNNLSDEQRETITRRLKRASEYEQPSAYPKAKHLTGTDGLFRIRAGDARAVCGLQKPQLHVYKIGKRSSVYEIIDDIEDRIPQDTA